MASSTRILQAQILNLRQHATSSSQLGLRTRNIASHIITTRSLSYFLRSYASSERLRVSCDGISSYVAGQIPCVNLFRAQLTTTIQAQVEDPKSHTWGSFISYRIEVLLYKPRDESRYAIFVAVFSIIILFLPASDVELVISLLYLFTMLPKMYRLRSVCGQVKRSFCLPSQFLNSPPRKKAWHFYRVHSI